MAYCTFSRAATSLTDISLKGLSVFVPGKELLIDVDLKLSFRKRYAIVAPNGAGKTVLMKLIATRQIPITVEKTIYLVDQILLHPSGTCLQYVIEADTRREKLQSEEEEILQAIESGADEQLFEDRLERLEYVQDLLSIEEDTKAKASKVLSGLGFSEAMKNGPTESLSGGWRMRLSLARALLLSPDILLLDEPTNHLDFKSVVWLEYHLQTWRKTIVIVTHDREFIDSVATDIICIKDQKLLRVRGDYDDLLKTIAQSKPGKVTVPPFDFGSCEYELPPSAAINITDVAFNYHSDEHFIIRDLEMCLHPKSRVAVIGMNGSGKSTLLHLISGVLSPTDGEIKRNNKMRIAFYGQHTVDDLSTDDTSIQYLRTHHSSLDVTRIHQILSKFGLPHVDRTKKLSMLSGGQRSRLVFASIFLSKPHLLVMDEPTNHLDIMSIDALADAIASFPGGVILASHNLQLLSAVTNNSERSEVWMVENGLVTKHHCGVAELRERILDEIET